MKLTREEQNILLVDGFIKKIHQDFDSVSRVYLLVPDVKDCPKYYQPKKDLFPLVVTLSHGDNRKSYYEWKQDSSDDEYPVCDTLGNYFGYNEMRDYITENLPVAFESKSFYAKESHFNSFNIGELVKPINLKLSVLNLEQSLGKNKVSEKRKIKI